MTTAITAIAILSILTLTGYAAHLYRRGDPPPAYLDPLTAGLIVAAAVSGIIGLAT